jgi:hypothetical protein
MTKKQRQALSRCTGKHKDVWCKGKNTSGKWLAGTIEDEVSIMVRDYKLVIQRIKSAPDNVRAWGKYAYRTGYWTLSAETRKPVWGQYHQIIGDREFRKLILRAEKKGWLV